MTNEEAIKMLKQWNEDLLPYEDEKEGIECHNIAISALEKQIPKRVELYKHNGDFKWENYPCPYCGEMLGLNVNKRYVKFCPNCGQALDFNGIGSDT